ncbi:MAG TPA: glycosyltransferase [Bacteroidota bacterium]|nr:glycosyltransferase [Bacteroidota bacterium]
MIAPFWTNPFHVGVYRMERFIRWLSKEGNRIVLLSAGVRDNVQEQPWGVEITLKDPLKMSGKYTDHKDGRKDKYRYLRRAWRFFSYVSIIPDQTIFWAMRIKRNSIVKEHLRDVALVLSSSPPESSHVASLEISRTCGAPLIIDLRDGWLDEPLRPIVDQLWLRRFLESRLEEKIIAKADAILVTSERWKEQLGERYPHASAKTTVLTNGYPVANDRVKNSTAKIPGSKAITLVHSGQFYASSRTRKIGSLLDPILGGGQHGGVARKIDIRLLGNLEPPDLNEFDRWKEKIAGLGWTLSHVPRVPRSAALEMIQEANGLLLLSASNAAIPSKLFEYIAALKPILAVTPRGSAVWKLCGRIPQVYLFDSFSGKEKDYSTVTEFLSACRSGNYQTDVPIEFSDEYLSRIFNGVVDGIRRH